jgi:hypothetical protein
VKTNMSKVFNPSEFHFSEVTFFQNWYFSIGILRKWGIYLKNRIS